MECASCIILGCIIWAMKRSERNFMFFIVLVFTESLNSAQRLSLGKENCYRSSSMFISAP
jgi:hypothetical protein